MILENLKLSHHLPLACALRREAAARRFKLFEFVKDGRDWKWNLSANALSQKFPVYSKWRGLDFNLHALCEKWLGVPSNPALISLEMGIINSMTKGKTGMDARSQNMQMMRADRQRWVKDFDCHSNRTACLDDRR